MTRIINQPINPGSAYGNELGFTADKFGGYLWDEEDSTLVLKVNGFTDD